MQDNRNFILAIVLTMGLLLGYEYFYSQPLEEQAALAAQVEQERLEAEKSSDLPSMEAGGSLPGMAAPVVKDMMVSREDIVGTGARIAISSTHLHGSISLKGARFDDLTLDDYKETLDVNSPDVVLLSPSGTDKAYYAEFGWIGKGKRPDADTVWKTDSMTLGADGKVTLNWDNGEGLKFIRTITLDDNYMFSVTQRVENSGTEAVSLAPYGLVSRRGRTVSGQSTYILHEGPIWVTDEGKEEFTYSDLEDEDDMTEGASSGGGWVGITDKYWLVSLIPSQKEAFTSRVFRREAASGERFQTDYLMDAQTIQPGGFVENETLVFAGAKRVALIDDYAEKYDIKLFDRSIDWGWLYFLTKPIFTGLDFFYGLLGNFGLAIMMLTVVIKLLLFPLANKQYESMGKMKKLQPKMKELKEKHGDDRTKMQQATMELYKKEQVNPLASCLPILIQIPVFFSLYKVLYVTIDMRQAPFYGWIKDLSAPDPMIVTNLFGLIPWDPPGFLAIGILPIFMGITMWLQQKMNPAATDPIQQKIFAFMPIIFTFILAQFSVGLVLYWTWNNILTIIQQWVIMRRVGAKISD